MPFLDALKKGPSAKTWKAPTEADRQFEIATKRIEEQQEWNEEQADKRQERFRDLRELEAKGRRAELRRQNEYAYSPVLRPNMHRLNSLDLAARPRPPLGVRPMPNPMYLRQPSPHHEMERLRQLQRRKEFMSLRQQRARVQIEAARAREAERALEAQRSHEARQQLQNARMRLEHEAQSFAREADLANRERLASIQRERTTSPKMPMSPQSPFSPYEETTSTFVHPFPNQRPRRLSEPPLPNYPLSPRTPASVPWSPSMAGPRLSPPRQMYPPTSGSPYTVGPPPRMRRRSSHELEIPSMAAMTPRQYSNDPARQMAMQEQMAMQQGFRQQNSPFSQQARNRQSAIF